MRRRSVFRLLKHFALPLLLGLASCSDLVEPDDGSIDSIVVEPGNPVVEEGAQLQLTARVVGTSGEVLQGRTVYWASEDPDVAALSEAGVLQGISRGTTRVAASAEGKHAMVEVRVVPVPVGTVAISPSSLRLSVNESETLAVTVRDRNGTRVTDREVTWSSSEASVAEVDGSGTVTARRPGQTQITATVEEVSATIEVRVRPGPPSKLEVVAGDDQEGEPGATLSEPLAIQVIDSDGNPVPDVEVRWQADGGSVSPSSVETDTNGEAAATWRLGNSGGEQTATASVGNLTARFSARVRPKPVASVQVSPSATTVQVDGTRQLSVTVRDSNGDPVSGSTVTWSSSSTGVARVSSSGLVTGRSPGTATITAAVGNVKGEASVVVVPGAPSQLARVSGNAQEAGPSERLGEPLVIRVVDSRGNAVPEVNVRWTAEHGSVSPGSTTTGSNGQASTSWTLGASSGTQRVTARVGDLSVGFTATATSSEPPPPPPAVGSVTVSPANLVLQVEQSRQLEADVRDVEGAVLQGREITWSSSSSSVAEVSSTGRVTARGVGTARITATSEGVQGTADVAVLPGAPATLSIVSGDGQQAAKNTRLEKPLVVRVVDALGNRIPDVTVQWSANRGGSMSPTSSKTNADGEASARWTLGDPVGDHQATATVGTLSVTFAARSLPTPHAEEEEHLPEDP